MNELNSTKAPALPIASSEYAKSYQDRYSNILRLYFNQIDNMTSVVLGDDGGRYFQNPHISASGTTDQYATGDNIPTLVLFNTLESSSGFTLNISGTATAAYTGLYKIDFSLQFANTDNVAHDVLVWLQTNGTAVPDSTSRFTIPARKSAGVFGYVVGYSSITFAINDADEIKLYWATEKAYNPVGPVDGIYMDSLPAQTSPYVRPANPSAIGSIVFVSAIPS